MVTDEEWRPGSFTKNFSWGPRSDGLLQLYESIKLGFANEMRDVPRIQFRERVELAHRPDYIPINFFLFNRVSHGKDILVADELVFQALNNEHSDRFDKLALFAFNFSVVGRWTGSGAHQRRPALWAFHYILERVATEFGWNADFVSADDIERFVRNDKRYRGQTARKLATNLYYLYQIGRLSEFADRRVDRWWVDALFLALDRIIEDRTLDGTATREDQYVDLLSRYNFITVSGAPSLDKELAVRHLVSLYTACGGIARFSEESVRKRTELALPDVEWLIANDDRAQAAVHATNPRILKNIPRACAMLARYAGFDVLDADELANFDPEEFVRRHTVRALQRLATDKIKPIMSAAELMKITRER
jgi:hypothetical protein